MTKNKRRIQCTNKKEEEEEGNKTNYTHTHTHIDIELFCLCGYRDIFSHFELDFVQVAKPSSNYIKSIWNNFIKCKHFNAPTNPIVNFRLSQIVLRLTLVRCFVTCAFFLPFFNLRKKILFFFYFNPIWMIFCCSILR